MTQSRAASRAGMTAAILLILIALTAVNAAAVAELLRQRIQLCLETLIPSLFGCMVLANLLTACGAAAWLGSRMRPLAQIMHIPPEVLTIFVISQIAGYPVGTLLLRQSADCGHIPQDIAARMSYVCFGGGPAFLVGLAGAQMLGNAAAGWCMMATCIAANLILLAIFGHGLPQTAEFSPATVRSSPEMLTEAVRDAMRSLAAICGTVLMFGVMMQLCEAIGLTAGLCVLAGRFGIAPQTVRALLAAVSDVTQLPYLMHCGLSYRILFSLTGGLLSFGGICVHLQCTALGGGRVRMGKMLVIRLFAALLTAWMLYPLTGMFALPEQAAVFAVHRAVPAAGSPIPALLIFCTGFPILLKKD